MIKKMKIKSHRFGWILKMLGLSGKWSYLPLAKSEAMNTSPVFSSILRGTLYALDDFCCNLVFGKAKVSDLPLHQLLWFLAINYLDLGFEPLVSQLWVRRSYPFRNCVVSAWLAWNLPLRMLIYEGIPFNKFCHCSNRIRFEKEAARVIFKKHEWNLYFS